MIRFDSEPETFTIVQLFSVSVLGIIDSIQTLIKSNFFCVTNSTPSLCSILIIDLMVYG